MKVTIRTQGEEETLVLGRRIGAVLRRGDVVAVEGDLGSGKTVLARGIAAGAGASGYVASPTFTLIREYAGPVPIYHVDLFRLTPAEVTDLGLEEVAERGVMVVEWAEKAPWLQRPPQLRITIAFAAAPDERIITLAADGPGPTAAVAAVSGIGAGV